MAPLCANRDCGAFLDDRAVPHENLRTHVVVFLCHDCAKYVQRTPGDWQFREVRLPLSTQRSEQE